MSELWYERPISGSKRLAAGKAGERVEEAFGARFRLFGLAGSLTVKEKEFVSQLQPDLLLPFSRNAGSLTRSECGCLVAL